MTTENQSAKQPVAERIRGAPREEGRLFRLVVAWPEDVQGARRSVRETFAEPPRRTVRRTVWDVSADARSRILVDVVECVSATDALAALSDRLEWNELAEVADGPADLGIARFAHPAGVPPAVFFARANLCVTVVSFAPKPADVTPVANRIDKRLTAAMPAAPSAAGAQLAVAQRPTEREGHIITISAPFPLSDDGYEQYSVDDGTLSIQEGQVIVSAGRSGARVNAYVVERGREPLGGTVVIGRP